MRYLGLTWTNYPPVYYDLSDPRCESQWIFTSTCCQFPRNIDLVSVDELWIHGGTGFQFSCYIPSLVHNNNYIMFSKNINSHLIISIIQWCIIYPKYFPDSWNTDRLISHDHGDIAGKDLGCEPSASSSLCQQSIPQDRTEWGANTTMDFDWTTCANLGF